MKSIRISAMVAVVSLLAVSASAISSAASSKSVTISVASLIPGSTPAAVQQFNNQVNEFQKANPSIHIKSVEYHEKYVEHHIPGPGFSIDDFVHPHDPRDVALAPDVAQHAQIFFFLYFAMTGMHALHMIIGASILVVLIYKAWQGAYTTGHTSTIDNFGLYWHFVDIVWIFLFPLLYLISRHPLH